MGKKCYCAASLAFSNLAFVEFGGTYGNGADPSLAYGCEAPTVVVFPGHMEDIPTDIEALTLTFSNPMRPGVEGVGECTTPGVSFCGPDGVSDANVTLTFEWNVGYTVLRVTPHGLVFDRNYTMVLDEGMCHDFREVFFRTGGGGWVCWWALRFPRLCTFVSLFLALIPRCDCVVPQSPGRPCGWHGASD